MVVAQTKIVAVEVVKIGQILNIVKLRQVRSPNRLSTGDGGELRVIPKLLV